MAKLRDAIRRSDVQGWADRFLAALGEPIRGLSGRRGAEARPTIRRRWPPSPPSLARPLLVGLDVDGVLAPIVGHADDAGCCREMVDVVADAGRARTPVAVVSGRSVADLDPLRVPGSRSPSSAATGWSGAPVPQSSSSATSRQRLERLGELAEERGGAGRGGGVGRAQAGRCRAPRPRGRSPRARRRHATQLLRDSHRTSTGAHVKTGHGVVELLARTTSKATAIGRPARRAVGARAVVFVGDDRTDEEVFAALGAGDCSVRVGAGPTVAGYRLAGPPEVLACLDALRAALHRLTERRSFHPDTSSSGCGESVRQLADAIRVQCESESRKPAFWARILPAGERHRAQNTNTAQIPHRRAPVASAHRSNTSRLKSSSTNERVEKPGRVEPIGARAHRTRRRAWERGHKLCRSQPSGTSRTSWGSSAARGIGAAGGPRRRPPMRARVANVARCSTTSVADPASASRSIRQMPRDLAVVAAPCLSPGRLAVRRGPALGGDEPRAVGVRQHDVVVLGQEPHRRRRVGIGRARRAGRTAPGPRSSRNVRSCGRRRSNTARSPVRRDHVGGVGHRRRAEGAEVAEHDVVDRRRAHQRPAEPVLGGGRRHLRRPPPHAARRHLHEREVVAARVRQRAGVGGRGSASASAARSSLPLRGRSARSSSATASTRSRSTPSRWGANSGWRRSSASSTGWKSGRSRERVVGGDEVDRAPHDDDADHLAVEQQLRRARRVEVRRAVTTAPCTGSSGLLRLQPDEVTDRVEHGLPRQRSSSSWRASVARPSARLSTDVRHAFRTASAARRGTCA